MDILLHNLIHGFQISLLVFIMMVIVDVVNTLSSGKMTTLLQKNKQKKFFKQNVFSSFLGATPGCLGVFANTSFYMHGILSFGALTAGMIATSGDEAFMMLVLFPKQALLLFLILFVIGIISGYIIDLFYSKINKSKNTSAKENCVHQIVHTEVKQKAFRLDNIKLLKDFTFVRLLLLILLLLFTGFFILHSKEFHWKEITIAILLTVMFLITFFSSEHYIEEHIFNHIAKKHFIRIFLWSFASLLVIDIALQYLDFASFAKNNMPWILLISAVVGLIPESGPSLIFITLFAQGVIPFSVLLTSSIVQDGHGMLPLLSYSIKDAMLIKFINVMIGLSVGGCLYLLGY